MKLSILNFNFFRVLLICFSVFLSSCSFKKKDDRDLWIGKEVKIPEITSNEKKIVTRFEGDCPSCVASITTWKEISSAIRAKNNNVKIIFYVEIIREESFKDLKRKLDFADYVIFDQRGSFFSKNLLKFPYGLEDQTFLLNEKNKILLFGNPAVKKELIKEFIEKI